MIFKIKHNIIFWKLVIAQRQKTFNEKKFDEELKVLEEKQKKIKSEYDIGIKEIESKLEECRTKESLSQDEQIDCRRMDHQKVDLNTQVPRVESIPLQIAIMMNIVG